MNSTMSYKGYDAHIEYEDDGFYTGKVLGVSETIAFHAVTMDAVREAFHEAVENYIETCAKTGRKTN